MTTLITGAGLVGTSFGQVAAARDEKLVFVDPLPRADYLAERLPGADVIQIQDDVRNLAGLVDAVLTHKPDTIIHTAARIGGRAADPIHEGMSLNIGGTLNVAEAARLGGVRRIVLISTFGVYNWRRNPTEPITETFARGAGAAYSNSKAAQELILDAYRTAYGTEVVILRPGNVFGVGHFWGGSGGGEKVQTLLECGIRGEAARIPQHQTMDFVYLYSRDMGRAVDLAATASTLGDYPVYNLGYDSVTSFDTLVETARKLLPDLKVEIVPTRPPVSRSVPLDVSRARADLGWTPEFSLEDAFADYIEALRARMN